MSRRTQNYDIFPVNEWSGLAFFKKDLGHISWSKVGTEFGVMLRGEARHKPTFAYDIVRIHSLMIYKDLVDYNIVGNTKAPSLGCSLFISKLKAGYLLTTGQYTNYQTFSSLQFGPMLKSCFPCIHIDFKNTSDERIPFVPVGITRLFWSSKKPPTIIPNLKDVTRWLLRDK